MELGLDVNKSVLDLGDDRQVGYPSSVLVHVTDTARIHVSRL